MKLHRIMVWVLVPYIIASTVQGSTLLYWADESDRTIKCSEVDGSNMTTLISASAESVAIDTTRGKIYWAHPLTNKIQRANLIDGSDVEDVYLGGATIRQLAIDELCERLYWVEQGSQRIRQANLDGSNAIDVVTGVTEPYGLALDVLGDKIYWTSGTTLGGVDKLQRSDLDGSNVEDLLLTGGDALHGIALDLVNNQMYWTNDFPGPIGTIQRASLDGTGAETLFTGDLVTDYRSIAVDVDGRKIYFQEQQTGGHILRMDFDGSGVETIVAVGMPRGIALATYSNPVPEPTSLILWSGLGVIGLVVGQRRKAAR